MFRLVEVPLWLLVLIVLFAAVTFASHFLLPSVRWFFRRRMERAVARLNTRLRRPIQPFKLARRHDMIQRLIYDPEVNRAAVEHARARGIPENVAFEEARRYAREIVPRFSAAAYFGFAIRVARWLSRALYRVRLVPHRADALAGIPQDATVVFVINHRSNMDYVLVTYLAAEQSALAYAVGEWARVWPLSALIRAMGAYFIRRKSQNALYRTVLARYVALATEGGVTQAMFPEGGLSVTGALTAPKRGLLKYMVDQFDTEGRDLVFVPVALNYDRVLEDRILVEAAQRGGRRFQARISVVALFTLRQVMLWLRGRYRRFGTAAVSFGAPLSLREMRAAGRGDPQDLAGELIRRIGRAVPLVPVPLAAWALCQGAADRAAVTARIAWALEAVGARNPGGEGRPDPARWAATGLHILRRRGLIHEEGGRITVTEGEGPLLAYYAASLEHVLPAAEPANAATAKENAAVAGS